MIAGIIQYVSIIPEDSNANAKTDMSGTGKQENVSNKVLTMSLCSSLPYFLLSLLRFSIFFFENVFKIMN